jgi:hypothetical protein
VCVWNIFHDVGTNGAWAQGGQVTSGRRSHDRAATFIMICALWRVLLAQPIIRLCPLFRSSFDPIFSRTLIPSRKVFAPFSYQQSVRSLTTGLQNSGSNGISILNSVFECKFSMKFEFESLL